MQVFGWRESSLNAQVVASSARGCKSLSRITAFPVLSDLRNSPSISFCQTEFHLVSDCLSFGAFFRASFL